MILTGILLWLAAITIIILFFRGAYPRYSNGRLPLRQCRTDLLAIGAVRCDSRAVEAACPAPASTVSDMP